MIIDSRGVPGKLGSNYVICILDHDHSNSYELEMEAQFADHSFQLVENIVNLLRFQKRMLIRTFRKYCLDMHHRHS